METQFEEKVASEIEISVQRFLGEMESMVVAEGTTIKDLAETLGVDVKNMELNGKVALSGEKVSQNDVIRLQMKKITGGRHA